MKLQDGAGVRCGGRNWTVVVDENEDGRSSWYECDGCGGTASGDDSMSDHACWFDCPENVAAFARWAAKTGWSAKELADAIEKPWHYNEEAQEAGVA